MPRKKPFPSEADTEPGTAHGTTSRPESGPAPKGSRTRSEAPTLPPPARSDDASIDEVPSSRPPVADMDRVRRASASTVPPPPKARAAARAEKASASTSRPSPRPPRVSDVRDVEPRRRSKGPGAATIDEVTADLSRDPRRDQDDDA